MSANITVSNGILDTVISNSAAGREWWVPATTPITEDQWHERVDTAIIFSVFCVIGVITNALPIMLTFCTALRQNSIHLMVGSLSTSDLALSLLFVLAQNRYILYREEIDFAGCRWLAWFTFMTAIFAFLFPPQVALNRYVSLYHSAYYKFIYTKRKVTVMVIGTWLVSTIIPFIFTLGGQTGFDDDNQHCCIVVKYSHWAWSFFYWAVIVVPLVIFCDGTMMFCNYKMYKKLSDHSHIQTLKSNVVQRNKELFYFLVADMCFPVFFHTVYHVTKFVYVYRVSIVGKRAFTCLYLINSCVRGLVTLSMLRPYREAVKKLFCFWRAKNSVGPSNVISGQPDVYRVSTPAVKSTPQ